MPLVGAVVVALAAADQPRPGEADGIGISLLTLALAIGAATVHLGGGMQLEEQHAWVKPLGVHYALGVDGLGLLMVLLTAVLVPLVLVASWRDADEGSTTAFVAWTLA